MFIEQQKDKKILLFNIRLRVLISKVGVYRPKVYNANVHETDGKLTNQTYICIY